MCLRLVLRWGLSFGELGKRWGGVCRQLGKRKFAEVGKRWASAGGAGFNGGLRKWFLTRGSNRGLY